MKILFLTPQRPWPPYQGTTIRNYHIIEQLAARHEIWLLSFLEANQPRDHGPLQELCQRVEVLPVPTRTTTGRLKQMLTTSRPDMSWRLWSPEFAQQVTDLLQKNTFDVIQIEGIEMAPYLPAIKKNAPHAKIIYDDHNAEWLLQYRNFITDLKNPRRWVAAAYSLVQTLRLKRYERWICREAHATIAVSQADKSAILKLDKNLNVTVVPNGVNLETHKPVTDQVINVDLVFTGKMDYRPNIDAMLWFGQEIFPLIQAKRPHTTLAIVGQKPHPRLNSLRDDPAITITGFVEDIRPYVAGAIVYIAPFRVGGGTRLKLLQAMAMQKAIISTTVGAEGYPVTSEREIILADTPTVMAKKILTLLDSPEQRRTLGQAAHQFVSANYTWQALIPTMEALYL